MICFRDKTWCVREDCRLFSTCDQALTDEVKQAAVEWWGGHDAPIMQTDQFICFEPKED